VGRLNSLESCFYKQYLTLKVRLNDTALGLGKLDKTQRNIGLLCAVLKVRSYSLQTLSPLIKSSYYVL